MNILFIKEKEGNTVNDVLLRILRYAELYVEANHIMPDCVKISNKNLKMIKEYNPTLIDDENRILHMEIIAYNPIAEERRKFNKHHANNKKVSKNI